jgi:hypothetical protein
MSFTGHADGTDGCEVFLSKGEDGESLVRIGHDGGGPVLASMAIGFGRLAASLQNQPIATQYSGY